MENTIDISIIIVNYNLTESIRNLLLSIKKYTDTICYEVIIVDNNSPDRSIEELKTEFPEFSFVFLNTNFGFGHGNNSGFAKSRGEYLLLLNPDTYLVDNMPTGLFRFAKQNPNFGIIGPKMIFPDGRFQVSSAKFPGILKEIGDLSGLSIRTTRLANFIKFKMGKRKIFEVDYIFGSCMLIKADLYKQLKGFDEDYFLFTEEVDLCYRTKKNTSYKVIYYLNEKIVHMKSLINSLRNIIRPLDFLF
jgi:GT2 family glycosyltransferase